MSSEKYQAYLCSREWGLKRQQVIGRYKGRCGRCRRSDGYAVHHKTYARIYRERLTDLILLCEGCHDFVGGHSHDDPVRVWRVYRGAYRACHLDMRAEDFWIADTCLLIKPTDKELEDIWVSAVLEAAAEYDAKFPVFEYA